ncbi:hypothetical protein PIB30_005636 [Stylosanthes scabra]|uniref:Transcription repressor n=1 Tax=Stylosanthes scabra TaxID=79078 RepID=A0ABU6T3U3_9FABA|nr:hypothetical protein [Stylosanthes scabra]
MGNNKFRFSDMIPNAWFYKLKDMSKSRKRNGSHHHHNHVLKNKSNSKVTSPTASQRSHPRCSNYLPNEPFIRAGKLYDTKIHNSKDFFGGNIPFPFTDSSSPRMSSSKRRSRRKTIYKPSPTVVVSSSNSTFMANSNFDSAHNNLQSPDYDASSVESSSGSDDDFNEYVYSESECDSFSVPDLLNGIDSNCSCRVSSSTNDIIIDMNNEHFKGNMGKKDGLETISQLGLAPIMTKSERFDDKVIEFEAAEFRRSSSEFDDELQGDESLNAKSSIEEINGRAHRRRKSGHISRRPPTNSPTGIRLRVNSSKLASRKIQAYARKSVSSNGSKASRNAGFPDGFAVVKSSFDPQSDFRDSMLEMIIENNIRASKDLEDLLACYLSLNSTEFHDLIVKAFEQIWFEFAQLRM